MIFNKTKIFAEDEIYCCYLNFKAVQVKYNFLKYNYTVTYCQPWFCLMA